MSTTLPHGIIQINEGNIAWYGDITANWQLIDGKIGIYDAAIASIPAPANNGTLTINYGDTTLAMFGADDAGNVSADIPAPGDGTLTIQLNGTDVQTFTANQAGNVTANIETPPVNDGTLTIMVDGLTAGTFSANQSSNSVIELTSGGGGSADKQREHSPRRTASITSLTATQKAFIHTSPWRCSPGSLTTAKS